MSWKLALSWFRVVTMKLYVIRFFVNEAGLDEPAPNIDIVQAENARLAIAEAEARYPRGNTFWVSNVWESNLFLEELSKLEIGK